MIDPDVLMYLLICTIILLPLVPAYFLFHAMPEGSSSAEATGPWQGLKLKLGGAFAGYFIVVIMVCSAYKLVKQPVGFQVWDVKGNITDTDGNNVAPIAAQDFSSDPGWLRDPDGSNFHMYVFTRPGNSSTEYPTIHIRHGDKEAYVNLDPNQPPRNGPPVIKWNNSQHSISIKDVPFTKMASYNDNQAVVQLPAP